MEYTERRTEIRRIFSATTRLNMEIQHQINLTVYGTRGSIPVSGSSFAKFGGATSCYLIDADGQQIILDAGTGIKNIPSVFLGDKPINILLSHTHIDHIIGLPFFTPMQEEGRIINVYSVPRNGLSTYDQLSKLFSSPLWPVGISDYPADVRCYDITAPFTVGDFAIDFIDSPHPGGSVVYSINYCGHKIVYATDFEHTGHSIPELTELAKNADVLMYDGQYTDEEYENKRGYGHSTPRIGMKIFENSGAKNLMFIHHAPEKNDDALLELEDAVRTDNIRYAREGVNLIL